MEIVISLIRQEKWAIDLIGILGIFCGTFIISGGVFRSNLVLKYMENYGENVAFKYKAFAVLLGLSSNPVDWINIDIAGLSEKEQIKYQDPSGPIRGFLWIAFGSILQIASLFIH